MLDKFLTVENVKINDEIAGRRHILRTLNRQDYEGQKGKSINVNYWWNMGDTSTKSQYFINDWYLG
jgi:hypothetical protein